MKLLVLFTLIALAYAAKPFHTTNVQATVGAPWPLPQTFMSSPTYFNIDPSNFKFLVKGGECDILTEAIKRYKDLTFINGCDDLFYQRRAFLRGGMKTRIHNKSLYLGQLQNLTIQYVKCEKYPYMNMNEQYTLHVNSSSFPGQAVLFGSTVWGVLRGLETFSQLVYQLESGQFIINSTAILDYPRFSFRGLMLDTARHYISIDKILENLDLMAQSKLNVFHWHIVDDQSFPYVSKTFPQLYEKGAYNPTTHIYTQKDIAAVIEYARLRGIRVVVEFDTPGHTLSWGKGQASLLTSCYNGSSPIPGNFGPIDPTNDTNYDFLKALFSEIASMFPDNYIHLGGDEVSFDCWQSNPNILKFMEKMKFGKDFSRLEEYYVQRFMDDSLKSLNKSYIVWQEVYDNGVKINPDTVIHVWKDGYTQELQNVTKDGFKTILSSCWYLNRIKYGIDWQDFYKCDPQQFNGTDQQKRLVIGGEACMWAEFVDGSNIISRTWPRTSVVAERLWSSQSANLSSEAAPRLEEHHCRLLKRGYRVENVNGPGFCECDYKL